MGNEAISYYSCNEVCFEPGNVPEAVQHSGINLFTSKTASMQRLKRSVWPGSISAEQREELSSRLANDIRVSSSFERLGNLFILSIIHRFLSLFTSSLKLYIDNSNIRTSFKYAASFAFSVLPALFLIFVVDYPPYDLILNSCISQTIATIVSYCSLKMGNFLRSIDLISDNKEFSKVSYLSKLIAYSAIDIGLTLIWRGKAVYTDPLKYESYNIVRYCIEKSSNIKTADMIRSVAIVKPLISIAEKLAWLAGRIVFDGIIIGFHKLDHIKDIRSPFINAFPEKPIEKERFKVAKERKNTIRRLHNNEQNQDVKTLNPGGIKRENINRDGAAQTDLDNKQVNRREKTKTRSPVATITPLESNATESSEETLIATRKITIKDYTFYQLDNPRLPDNTWGVISLKSNTNDDIFERSLETGRMANRHSALKHLQGNSYEIRPKSIGDRLLGRLSTGMAGFNTLFSLGEAMVAYDQLKSINPESNEPNLIIFTHRAKHEAIAKTVARLSS